MTTHISKSVRSAAAEFHGNWQPLAAHIRYVLDERSSHEAPGRRFRDELEDHMSEDNAANTLRAVTEWARYAEHFAYNGEADLFTLENPS